MAREQGEGTMNQCSRCSHEFEPKEFRRSSLLYGEIEVMLNEIENMDSDMSVGEIEAVANDLLISSASEKKLHQLTTGKTYAYKGAKLIKHVMALRRAIKSCAQLTYLASRIEKKKVEDKG